MSPFPNRLRGRRGLCLFLALVAAACATVGPRTPSPSLHAGFLTVEQGRLYYEVAGRGPAVVLLHGGFGDRRMWDEQVEALAADFRVVRYDQRGFGRSSPPQGPYSPVADLLRLLDHLRIERAHLVGNSMGGALALDFALSHSDRVDGLVVAASGANGYPYTPEDTASVVAVFRAARQEGSGRGAQLWLQHPMVALSSRNPGVRPRLWTMIWENREIFRMQHWPSERLEPPAFARLGEIRRPTLFIVGSGDTPLVRRVARESADRVPNAQWKELAGADHLPQMTQPREFNAVLREFLRANRLRLCARRGSVG